MKEEGYDLFDQNLSSRGLLKVPMGIMTIFRLGQTT